jgi:hypothetical protein
MQTIFGSLYLGFVALFFFYTAWRSGFQPEQFARDLGLGIIDSGGYAEIRGQYTGFFFVSAMLCVLSLCQAIPRPFAYVTLAVIFGGLIIGRLVNLVIHRSFAGYSQTISALYFIDAVGFLLAVTAIFADGFSYF